MLVRALLTVSLLGVLGRTDKLPQRARKIRLPDAYLPPPNVYLPPSSYLPPNKEYLPPPPTGLGELTLPSAGLGELTLPSAGLGELTLPSAEAGKVTPPSAEAGAALVEHPSASLASVVEARPSLPSSAPDLEQAVVLDSDSAHPGFCPRRQLTRSCLLVKSAPKECFADVDCGQRQKCCALDCGLQCIDAVVKPSSCDKIVCSKPGEECVDLETGPACIGHSKAGQCPFFSQHCSNRILVCREDAGCEGDKLCCNLGCHRLCVDPAPNEQHRGFCPEVVSRPPTRCGIQCESDDDCSSELKCCDNACGRVCQPGVVPFITCANRNCPSNTKCEMLGLEAVCKALQPAP